MWILCNMTTLRQLFPSGLAVGEITEKYQHHGQWNLPPFAKLNLSPLHEVTLTTLNFAPLIHTFNWHSWLNSVRFGKLLFHVGLRPLKDFCHGSSWKGLINTTYCTSRYKWLHYQQGMFSWFRWHAKLVYGDNVCFWNSDSLRAVFVIDSIT